MDFRSVREWLVLALLCSSALLSACPRGNGDSDAGQTDGVGGQTNSHGRGKGGDGSGPDGYSGGSGAAQCLRTSQTVAVRPVGKVDLLLVVDNSNSMAGEQAAFAAQFPALVRTLTTGYRFPDDPDPFPPVKDLHVGVVSTDMGIPGVDLPPACHANGGDDGKLQSSPHGDSCDPQYPSFLSFVGDTTLGELTDSQRFANDLGCIASLGTGGCGFEQQLEAAFKALMPRLLTDAAGNVLPNPYRFIATDEPRTWGRGDLPTAEGGNRGFLRDALAEGPSVIAIVLLTDEEDCSVRSTEHLKPNNQLPESSPYRSEDINLRCFFHKEFLYDLEERYLRGFRLLRPGHEEQVIFAAIAGVPTDLVSNQVLSQVDYTNEANRNAFYDAILNDQRMIETVDSTTMPGSGQGNLRPSCVRPPAPGETMPSTAFPPRRIVELARLFGQNGIVQSICQDDLGPAISVVVDVIAKQLGEPCLPRAVSRQSSGLTACDVVWELPAQVELGSPTPTDCAELPFLGPVDSGQATTNSRGGMNCKVQQLAVTNPTKGIPPLGEGWFYDDFTEDLVRSCSPQRRQRIAFTAAAKPPMGVVVKLNCLSPVSNAAGDATMIGEACTGDQGCVLNQSDGTVDYSHFCHPALEACVKSCTADAQCPSGWKCDSSPEAVQATTGRGGGFCIDPKCTP